MDKQLQAGEQHVLYYIISLYYFIISVSQNTR